MNSEDGQVNSVCILYFCFILLSTTVCSQNKNKQIVNIADENLTDYTFSLGITILNQRIIQKDDIKLSLKSHVYCDTLYLPLHWFKS